MLSLVIGVALSCVLGCRADPPPALLDVVTFAPSEVDLGDRFEVLGNGLPEGRTATLTFRGELFRPGREPMRVDIVTPAIGSQRRITATLTSALHAEFCGSGHDAQHTTFRGDVIAAFAPKRSSAPPVTGVVHGVVFDIEPSRVPSRIAEGREQEGRSALEFLGIRPMEAAPPDKVVISSVAAGGLAERAGLSAGDIVLSVDGVNVRNVSDVVPASKRRFARVSVQRGRLPEPLERLVDFTGFRQTAPSELSAAALMVGLAAAIVLLFVLPPARLLTWVERRVVLRLRARGRSPALTRVLGEALSVEPLASSLPSRVAAYLILIGVSAGFTLIASGRPLYHADLDLSILLLAALILRVTLAVGAGGWRGGHWSLRAGLVNGFSAASFKLPLLFALAAVVTMTGTVRSDDFVSLQGAMPWRWLVLQGPTLLFAWLFALFAMVPEVTRPARELPEAEESGAPIAKPERALDLVALSEWTDLLISAGVVAVVFLGGWRLPLVSPAVQLGSTGLMLAGALLLLFKSTGLVLLILCARWVFARVAASTVLGLCWRRLIPLSLGCFALTIGWSEAIERPVWRALQSGLGELLFGLGVFVLVHLVIRVARNLNGAGSQVNVNPWL